MHRRYFTLEEVHRSLPQVQSKVLTVVQLRASLRGSLKYLEGTEWMPDRNDFEAAPEGAPFEVTAHLAAAKACSLTMREQVKEIGDAGAFLRDLESPLVEWMGRWRGNTIFFVWRMGEELVNTFRLDGAGEPVLFPVSALYAEHDVPTASLRLGATDAPSADERSPAISSLELEQASSVHSSTDDIG